MLAGGAAAEVLVGDDDVTGLDTLHEGRVEVLEAVLRELCRVGRVEIAGRDNHVGIDVTAVAEDVAFEFHGQSPSG